MPDFLRPAVYPVLLTCIVGSLWMLADSVKSSDEELEMAQMRNTRPHYSNLAAIRRSAGDDRYAELDPY